MKNLKLKKGMMVVVDGATIHVDEVNPDGTCWGTDCEGDEMEFTSEAVTAVCP